MKKLLLSLVGMGLISVSPAFGGGCGGCGGADKDAGEEQQEEILNCCGDEGCEKDRKEDCGDEGDCSEAE